MLRNELSNTRYVHRCNDGRITDTVRNSVFSCDVLWVLYLERNQIGDEGARAIGAALAQNSSVQTLELVSWVCY